MSEAMGERPRMGDGERTPIDFRTEPARYRHWKLTVDGPVATLAMDVREDGGLRPGYELKLNSYDLGVDIELYDAVQRLRFEHPEVGAVVVTSGKERIFCAGANIRMLGQSTHGFKVNFCKFTNETRNGIEEASAESRQVYLTAVNGPCAGGGYELALATDYILMVDDGNTSVALPEVPLLAVLPGTGGLTRLVDKRRVRRDRADVFCTLEEGIKGRRAVDWGLVDEIVPRSQLETTVRERARALAARTDRPAGARGLPWTRSPAPSTAIASSTGTCGARSTAPAGWPRSSVSGPGTPPPAEPAGIHAVGRRLLAARGGARAGRPDPPPPRQRGGDRDLAAPDRGERRPRRRARPLPRRSRERLAGAGDPPLPAPRPEAPRRLGAVAVRPRRARLVLHRAPCSSWRSPPTDRTCSTARGPATARRRRRCG